MPNGPATAFGEIADSLVAKPPPTAFEEGTHRFGLLIMRFTVLLVLFVLLINLFLIGHGLNLSFLPWPLRSVSLLRCSPW